MRKYISSTLIACILCLIVGFGTACSCHEEIEVKEIYFDKSVIDMSVGETLTCDAEALGLKILPSNATNTNINFIVTKEDRTESGVRIKVLDDSHKPTLVALSSGVATITARSADGSLSASVKVRVFAKDFTLPYPTGVGYDNTTQRIVWDARDYVIDGRYTSDVDHELSEVFYEVMLNGEIVAITKNNYFSDYPINQENVIRVRAITNPNNEHITSSNYSSAVSFKVLPSPENLRLTQQGLEWDGVENAHSYTIVVYKKEDDNLTIYDEIQNIRETTYSLDIQDAGDFVVEVKAVPAANNSNIYSSKGSNQVSVKKYSEIESLEIQNNRLIWNSVVSAEEYNVVLINKETSEQTKINVRASNNSEFVRFDLSTLTISGQLIAKIETISNYSLGLNSKISTIQKEFIKLKAPTADKIENNALKFKPYTEMNNVQVLVKIGDREMDEAETTFSLPEETIAGEYDLYFKAIGNGTTIISSSWTTEPYFVTKLAAPTEVSNVGYNITINKPIGANNINFIDICDEFAEPASVDAELLSENDSSFVYNIYVADKFESYNDLYKNKYVLKMVATGDNVFDSNPSDLDFTFYKIAPMRDVGVSVSGGVITFQNMNLPIITSIPGLSENPNKEVLDKIVKYDEENGAYYYDVCVKVYRLLGSNEQELYMILLSKDSKTLVLSDLNDVSGGTLIFKIFYYGNQTDVLASDERVCKWQSNLSQTFSMKKAYEPTDLTVTNSTLGWEVVEKERDDLFVIYKIVGDDTEEIYRGVEAQTDSVRNSLIDTNILQNFAIINYIDNKDHSVYWQNSKVVRFSAGVLNTPQIAFNGDYIEWNEIEHAKCYYVYFNDQVTTINAAEANEGVLKINYKELFSQKGGEVVVKVVASCGPSSEDLWFNSAESNSLTIRNVKVIAVGVTGSKILFKANEFDYDVVLHAKLINGLGSEVYVDNATYDAFASFSSYTGCFVFDLGAQSLSAGYYNVKFKFEYSLDQSAQTQLRYISYDEFEIKNIVRARDNLQVNFNTSQSEAPIASWAATESVGGYVLYIKNTVTNNVIEIAISDPETTSYNLTNVPNLVTSGKYQLAIVAKGDSTLVVKNYTIEDSTTKIESSTNNAYILPTKAVYLTSGYNSGNTYFAIAGRVQNITTSTTGNVVSLYWDEEEGIKYEIYVNDAETPTDVVYNAPYMYIIDTNIERIVSFRIRAISASNRDVYSSAISSPISVNLLAPVSNLQVNGYITFEYTTEEDSQQFVVEIFDTENNTSRYRVVTQDKKLNLSTVSGLEAGRTYKVSVIALGNGVSTINSPEEVVTDITIASALTLDIDATEAVFITNNTLPYITFFATRYVSGVYTEEYSYGPYASADSPKWNIGDTVPAGYYKVWASGTTTSSCSNEFFGIASNYLYIIVLDAPTSLKITTEGIEFMPIWSYTSYIINIDGQVFDYNITDTSVLNYYNNSLLEVAGNHSITIKTKGNYNKVTTESFTATANSPDSTTLNIVRLAQPSNINVANGKLSFNRCPNADLYRIVFSCAGQDDIVVETIHTSIVLKDYLTTAGTYSCSIQAVGDILKNVLSSVVVNYSSNIVISSTENITLTMSEVNRCLEWNAVSTSNGYVVKFVNVANNNVKEVVVYSNLCQIPGDLTSGSYNITVRVKGNGTNIVDGDESAAINVLRLNEVTGLRKVQTVEQDAQNQIVLTYALSSQTNRYAVRVVKPDGSENVDIITRTSLENPFTYTFDNTDSSNAQGVYLFGVTALGDFVTTIDSAESVLVLERLVKPQDLTFTYETSTTAAQQMRVNVSVSWMAQENEDIDYQIQFNVFGNVIENAHVTMNSNKTIYTAVFDVSSIRKATNTIKVRFGIALNNQAYVSSDWSTLDIYVFNPITITRVQNRTMYFNYDSADESSLSHVQNMIVYARNTQTSQISKAVQVSCSQLEEVDIFTLVDNLPAGTYKIGAYIIGDGGVYLGSSVSNEFEFVKTSTPVLALTKSLNLQIYGTFLIWDAITGASGYLVKINGSDYATVTETYFNITEIIQTMAGNVTEFSVCVVGESGYTLSDVASISVKPADIGDFVIDENLERGCVSLSAFLDYIDNYYVIGIITSGSHVIQSIAMSSIFELPEDIEVSNSVKVKFMLVPRAFTIKENDEHVKYYEINSLYSTEKICNKLASGTIGFENGQLYVIAPEYTDLETGSDIEVIVSYGSFDELYIVKYNNTKQYLATPEFFTPALLNTSTAFQISYKFIGDAKNVSSSWTSYDSINSKFSILNTVSVAGQNGLLKWQPVENATGFKITAIHNIEDHPVSESIGNEFYTKTLPADALQYSMTELIAEIKENSSKKSHIQSDADFDIFITICALGSTSVNLGAVTYINGYYDQYEIIQVAQPVIKCSEGNLILQSVQESLAYCNKVEIDINGDTHVYYRNEINSAFGVSKQYTNVRMRFYGEELISGGNICQEYYCVSSNWTSTAEVNVLPTARVISLSANGFLTFVADWTSYNGMSFATMQGSSVNAYKGILIKVNDNIEYIDDVDISFDSVNNEVVGTMYLGTYLKGYLDFLAGPFADIQIAIVGATYDNEYNYNSFIISSLFSATKTLNKLPTPQNYTIYESVLMWDNIDNNSGYVLIIDKMQEEANAETGQIELILEIETATVSPVNYFNLLENINVFQAGTYRVSIRAIGSNLALCSNMTDYIEFIVYPVPEITINNGYIELSYVNEAQLVHLEGLDTVQNQDFESEYEPIFIGDTAKIELPNDIINTTITTYKLKFNFVGNGINTISGNQTEEITVIRLPRISGSIDSYQGKVRWSPVTFSNTSDVVTSYTIHITDRDNFMSTEFVVNVTDNDKVGGYYAIDIPPTEEISGDVIITIKPNGKYNVYDGRNYLNGPYSTELEAYRLTKDITLKINNSNEGNQGCLSWSSDQTNLSTFTLVVYTDWENMLYIENAEVISRYYYDIPETITLTNGDTMNLGNGTYYIGIKMVGHYTDNIHYLSAFSNMIKVERLASPSQIYCQNGVLSWSKVANANSYELVFVKNSASDPIVIKVAEQVNTETIRTFDMLTSSLTSGSYEYIKIRALGGSTLDGYAINGKYSQINEVLKLSTPSISVSLDTENNDGVYITFMPITYVEDGQTLVVRNYEVFLEELLTGAEETSILTIENVNTQVNYKFFTSTLSNGSYKLSIKALAPSETELNIVNSAYSEKVDVTKPGTITNLVYDNTYKRFVWDAPTGIVDSNITYSIYYSKEDESTSGVEYVLNPITGVTGTIFYPPTLGRYKIIVVAVVENCLSSDFMGENNTKFLDIYSEYTEANIKNFIDLYGVAGDNASLFDGGDGTYANPYIISSVEKFANMKYYSNANFYFELIADLGSRDSGVSFEDLIQFYEEGLTFASSSNPFKAHFNGANHTIYLHNLSDNNTLYNGIFGYIDGATIENLNIVIVEENYIVSKSGMNLGVAVGYAKNATISNIVVNADIVITNRGGSGTFSMSAGGIVGVAEGNSSIDNCRFAGSLTFGDINSLMADTLNVSAYVGGIIGTLNYTGGKTYPIERCVNSATLHGTIIGGIVGKTNSGLNKCINLGEVYGIESANASPQSGGLVGSITLSYTSITFANSYNKGTMRTYVRSSSAARTSTGGLVGQTVYAVSNNTPTLAIVNMFSTADIYIISNYTTSYYIGLLLGSSNSVRITFNCTYFLSSANNQSYNYSIIGERNTTNVTYTNNYSPNKTLQEVANDIYNKFDVSYNHTYINSGGNIIMSDLTEIY